MYWGAAIIRIVINNTVYLSDYNVFPLISVICLSISYLPVKNAGKNAQKKRLMHLMMLYRTYQLHLF